MSKHTIQISDDYGKSFKIVLSIGWTGNSEGNWRALDSGFISHLMGRADYQLADEWLTPTNSSHVFLFENPQSTRYWGIRLNDYKDIFGVNEKGMGIIQPVWAVGLTPNRISWMLVD